MVFVLILSKGNANKVILNEQFVLDMKYDTLKIYCKSICYLFVRYLSVSAIFGAVFKCYFTFVKVMKMLVQ